MTENTNETTDTTPRVCYWLNEVDSDGGYAVSRVRENQSGHYPYTRFPQSITLEAAKATVEKWNAEVGITAADASAIVLSSMGAQGFKR